MRTGLRIVLEGSTILALAFFFGGTSLCAAIHQTAAHSRRLEW